METEVTREKVMLLMKEKDKIEEELKALQDVLKSQNVGKARIKMNLLFSILFIIYSKAWTNLLLMKKGSPGLTLMFTK